MNSARFWYQPVILFETARQLAYVMVAMQPRNHQPPKILDMANHMALAVVSLAGPDFGIGQWSVRCQCLSLARLGRNPHRILDFPTLLAVALWPFPRPWACPLPRRYQLIRMALPWELQKQTIRHLYLEEDKTLKQLRDEMEIKHNFKAR